MTLARAAAVALTRDGLADQLTAWLQALPRSPVQALGVNVGGEAVARTLADALHAVGCPVQWHTAQARTLGLVNGYREPRRLGADRWLSLVGLWAHPRHRAVPGALPGTRILATFGTATTVDTLTADGRFAGGLILPGVQMMLDSLARGTAQLPLAGGAAADFPDHTDAAIMSGVLAAQTGAWCASAVWRSNTSRICRCTWPWPAAPGRPSARSLRGR
ncbi:type III pantothenate kinase [Verticiella alkaliphila]|uniref:type III pantothenate kinase n=1 Tax=Verticiella alkaliphila TaxID=2779529 RepID=UPI0035305261